MSDVTLFHFLEYLVWFVIGFGVFFGSLLIFWLCLNRTRLGVLFCKFPGWHVPKKKGNDFYCINCKKELLQTTMGDYFPRKD